ncbi:hypothetical protein GCM10009549_23800 [Streptomyces thermoalcalitolerans]|uniref:Uncharacterized protein n=1 Tax=Streptomyces thermoalcalitolerans TaxID=65605 RepID=A0ABP3Z2C5_9ACTN
MQVMDEDDEDREDMGALRMRSAVRGGYAGDTADDHVEGGKSKAGARRAREKPWPDSGNGSDAEVAHDAHT